MRSPEVDLIFGLPSASTTVYRAAPNPPCHLLALTGRWSASMMSGYRRLHDVFNRARRIVC
jgi:hypothetical protein